MRYTYKCPVNSAIKTSKPLENCLTCLKLSETDILTPYFALFHGQIQAKF